MTKYRFIGIIGILISIILIGFYSNIISILTSFIEEHISHDHHIEPEGIDNIKKLISSIIILFIGVSTLLLIDGYKKISEVIKAFIDVKKAEQTFLINELTTKINVQKRLFIVGTTFGILLPFLLPIFNQPTSEGFIEEGSSLLFLIAGIILIVSVVRIDKNQFKPDIRKKIKILLVILSAVFITMFGEEISWGQRIFGWESTGVFKEYNVQSETNVHNFFNELFDIFYPILGLSLFISLCFLWFFPKKNRTYLSSLLFPHPSSFFLVFMMACLSYQGHSEIFEELLALFCVLYSLRIFYSLKFPKIKQLSF
jgi:hypothetical protein